MAHKRNYEAALDFDAANETVPLGEVLKLFDAFHKQLLARMPDAPPPANMQRFNTHLGAGVRALYEAAAHYYAAAQTAGWAELPPVAQ